MKNGTEDKSMQDGHNMNMQFICYLNSPTYGKLKGSTLKYRRHAFLSVMPSFSGTIWWMETNTSTGVKAGPIWAEPCHEQIISLSIFCWLRVGEGKNNTKVMRNKEMKHNLIISILEWNSAWTSAWDKQLVA